MDWVDLELGLDIAHLVTQGEGAVICVVDSGFKLPSPINYDLENAQIAVRDQEDSGDITGSDPQHGSLVAGAVYKVAPKSKIIPIRSGGGTSSGPRIRDALLRVGPIMHHVTFSAYLTWFEEVREVLREWNQKYGITVTASSGNSGAYKPRVEPELVMYIGSVDKATLNYREAFSNYGEHLFGVTPGNWVRTVHGSASGTSLSSPLAAGLCALLKSVNPNLTNDQVRECLKENARDIHIPGFDKHTGWGSLCLTKFPKNEPEIEVYRAIAFSKFVDGNLTKNIQKSYIAVFADYDKNLTAKFQGGPEYTLQKVRLTTDYHKKLTNKNAAFRMWANGVYSSVTITDENGKTFDVPLDINEVSVKMFS